MRPQLLSYNMKTCWCIQPDKYLQCYNQQNWLQADGYHLAENRSMENMSKAKMPLKSEDIEEQFISSVLD